MTSNSSVELKVIVIDSREKPNVIKPIKDYFDSVGQDYIIRGLLVGDYMYYHNPSYVIDRKHSISELCQNVQSADHQRFKRELEKAKKLGSHLCILVETDEARTLEDVREWVNPNRRKSLRSPTGETLYKALDTIRWRYEVDFEFCKPSEAGKKIIELLEAHDRE